MIPKSTGTAGLDGVRVFVLDRVVREDLEWPNMIAALIWRSLEFFVILCSFQVDDGSSKVLSRRMSFIFIFEYKYLQVSAQYSSTPPCSFPGSTLLLPPRS
jgi:hypothetical protein